MKREKILLWIFAIAFAFGSYMFFAFFFKPGIPDYAVNIAAAILGSIITVCITMILLNKQSEAEMLKERNAKLLEAKVDLYSDLIDRIKDVIKKGAVDRSDEIEMILLNHRLSFFAGENVLRSFNNFARKYVVYAKDHQLAEDEINDLMQDMGSLSVEIRYDLSSDEDKKGFDREILEKLISGNINELSKTSVTTENEFLEKCDSIGKSYFTELLKYLKDNKISYAMRTVGFSIQSAAGKSILRCYPQDSSKKNHLEFITRDISRERKDNLLFKLGNLNVRGTSTGIIALTIKDISVTDLCEIIGILNK
jgi:hypothetical protein